MREGGEKSCFTRGSAAQIFLGLDLGFFSYPKLGLGKCFPEGPYVLFVICLILFGRKMALI